MAALALISAGQLSAEIGFKQCRRGPVGEGPETVASKTYNLVCITEPGVKASINGEEAHVYNTGAFGLPVQLKEGENTITVVLKKGSESRTEELKVVYDPEAKGRGQRPPKPEADPSRPQPNTLYERLMYGVTLPGTYMQYGTGTDRLGGSRMGNLEPGITVKIVGQYNDLYKVQLSENKWTYIPMEYVAPSAKETKIVNTNNMSVSNQGEYDRISISLPDKLPYVVWCQTDPLTINLDVCGAMNNCNWISHRRDLEMIEYVDVVQIESDVCRFVIRLKEKYSWGYAIKYIGNTLTMDVKHSPALTLKGMKVGLDAGHGGEASPGAIGFTGLRESDVNLDIVMRVKKLLEAKGATVVLSRSEDVEVSMAARRKTFVDENVNIAISIHNNAGGGPYKPMGTSTYYKYITNRDLAGCLLDRMLELKVPNFGLVGNFNFSLGTPTEYPNALVEGLFMSSLPDEEILASEAGREQIAQKVVSGLEDYIAKVAEAKGKPSKSSKKK